MGEDCSTRQNTRHCVVAVAQSQVERRTNLLLSMLNLDANFVTAPINLVSFIAIKPQPETEITCANCRACCCRLEVMIISDTGVPAEHIAVDKWGAETMLRLADGWCSALDRDTFMCTIYENRPWICREFAMGSYECQDERAALIIVAR